jgi:hypothetical protein
LDDITNRSALVYHITMLSQNWQITNPYHAMLRCLLINTKTDIEPNALRDGQEYHFIAKMIYDELNLNRKGTKENVEKIVARTKAIGKNKQQSDADSLIRCLFYVVIMNLLGKGLHYDSLQRDKIAELLKELHTKDNNLQLMLRVLALVYGSNSEMTDVEINDDFGLSLDLLYRRLSICDSTKRDKNNLIEYYVKQNKLDSIDTITISSENTQCKLLEIAVILKAATGNGLYLPEIEREQYLSSFTKDFLRKKYKQIIEKENSFVLFGVTLPIWALILTCFALEAVIFSLPNYIESISLWILSIPTKPLLELPISVVIAVNGVVMVVYLLLRDRKLKQKVEDAQWK